MRTELRKRQGRFCVYRATFIRYGSRLREDGQVLPTVLLRNIQDGKGKLLTDHLWLRDADAAPFRDLPLRGGETLQFHAGVEPYMKGLDVIDYRLVRPMFIKVVS